MRYLWDKLVYVLIKNAWLMIMSDYNEELKNQKSKGKKNAKN